MKIHIVQKGDTLWEISKNYGVDFEQVKQLNPQLSSPDMIMPGMKIKIPSTSKPVKKETMQMKETQKPTTQQPYKDTSPKPIPVVKEDDEKKPKSVQPKMPMQPKMQPKLPMQPMFQMPMMEQEMNNYTTINLPEMPQYPIQEEEPEKMQQMPMQQPMIPIYCFCPPPPMHHAVPNAMGKKDCGCGGPQPMVSPMQSNQMPNQYPNQYAGQSQMPNQYPNQYAGQSQMPNQYPNQYAGQSQMPNQYPNQYAGKSQMPNQYPNQYAGESQMPNQYPNQYAGQSQMPNQYPNQYAGQSQMPMNNNPYHYGNMMESIEPSPSMEMPVKPTQSPQLNDYSPFNAQVPPQTMGAQQGFHSPNMPPQSYPHFANAANNNMPYPSPPGFAENSMLDFREDEEEDDSKGE
ncbi:SafA/ExsA family spore coat assembly protein [Virgibacillus litoralis]|uniref:Morphogenetic protein associated with SpoVID n=1 Tax=Virgibacillus litoralis TaxID=578221 RepID=A0ABS4H9T3_9BACI|nr:SafA/ExsA family spore coat assembly protein [Virgibacillus litoralis]MBP1947662.1 morphogenetic protein associated with SpoVID [Virgibacillus litoralis]